MDRSTEFLFEAAQHERMEELDDELMQELHETGTISDAGDGQAEP